MIVVGAPSYFATHPVPEHPRDLAQHACLNFRPGPDAAPYRWEFTDRESGREFTVLPPTRVLTNDVALIHRLARAGVGLTIARAERIRPFLDQGDLVAVLEATPRHFRLYSTTRNVGKRRRRSAHSSTTYARGGSGDAPRRHQRV